MSFDLRRLVTGFVLLLASPVAGDLRAQSGERGIPVTDAVVISKCGACHAHDEHGVMERVSFARTTPEGWQTILKDMIVLNNLSVTPEEARAIVKYLSSSHGLAPEEARPVMFDPERRVREEKNIPTETLRENCGKCHTFARSLSWRRSAGDWKQFADAHITRFKVKPAAAAEAVAYLSKAAPLHTPEWDAWIANKSVIPMEGRWLITAKLAGHGQFYGEMQLQRTGDDEFTSRVTLTSVKDGSKVVRTGKSAVYGGTAWRGRSGTAFGSDAAGPDDPASEAREVMWFAGDHLSGEGRWFWGQYQEFGFDVKLQRKAPGTAPAPILLLSDRASFKAGSQRQRIRLIGENLPAKVSVADLSLGSGVTVRNIVSSSPVEVVAEVDVAASAQSGYRDIAFGGAVMRNALAVYDRIDYMKVTPESAMAAFGDRQHPRGFQQFEAIGYQRGPDGRSHTDDDVELGPLDVTWALQVFHAADGDSSDFVGKMSPTGLLTPSTTNPNVNFDTWVVATARDEKNPVGDPLTGKAYVVVTIPTYAFNGRQYVRDLDKWVDDGPAIPGRGLNGRPPR